jgi:hypothetical protein
MFRQEQNTLYVHQFFFYRKSCFYEITRKNTVDSERTHKNIILRMRFLSWVIKAIDIPL